jgi:hypothetical protein
VNRLDHLQHEFVDTIPDALEDGRIYVSIRYRTVMHRCCCGCGFEAVTPLAPTEWSVTFDGDSISLSPSVGNWSFPCQSHYWIRRGHVQWARRWSPAEIAAGRQLNADQKGSTFTGVADDQQHTRKEHAHRRGLRLARWLRR